MSNHEHRLILALTKVEGRKLHVQALDGLRVAKVWLSTPSKKPARPDVEEGEDKGTRSS